MEALLAFLEKLGISFEKFDHPAVFTTAESSKLPRMPGADTKNLFLTEEGGQRFFLVTVPHDTRVDLQALARLIGVHRLTFGSPEDMEKMLGVTPGSVTLMGLMNDREGRVELMIEESIWNHDAIQCHPLINTATLVVPKSGMEKFLLATGHQPKVEKIPAK
jgi:Ala-tRNA(Pro) deacylase